MGARHGVECLFRRGDVTSLPFLEASACDVVIGLSILHHLSESNVIKALQECHRVLKPGGKALFYEPVENSRLFNFIQNLFPIGKKGDRRHRPSMLQRKQWAQYVAARDDRTMTNRELVSAGRANFSCVRISSHGFLIRLRRLVGYPEALAALDRFLFKAFPPLKYYSQMVLVEYRK
jgi:SAM-dependent methyltransferase